MSNNRPSTAARTLAARYGKQMQSLRVASAVIAARAGDRAASVIQIPLPPPISVNMLRKLDRSSLPLLQAWCDHADGLVYEAGGVRQLGRIDGPYEAHITYDRRLALDIDNGIKTILDYAVRLGVVNDDGPKYLKRLIVEHGEVPHGCRLELRAL